MASGPADEADADVGDAVSVTSTVDDSDEELLVDEILAERHIHGELHYLLLWQKLPLRDSTWEPRGNLPETLVAEWELAKARQRTGSAPRFTVQDWKDAILQGYDERCVRHNRRNLERARRGYPQTSISPTRQTLLENLRLFANDEECDGQRLGEAGLDGVAPALSEQGLPQDLSKNHSTLQTSQTEEGPEQGVPQPLPDDEPSSPAKQLAEGSEEGSHQDISNKKLSSPYKQPSDPERSDRGLPEKLPHNEPSPPKMQPVGGILDPSAPMAPSADTISPRNSLRETLFGESEEGPPDTPKLNPPAKLKSALKSAEATSRGSVRFLVPPSETSDEVPRRPSLSRRTPAAKSAVYTDVFKGGRTRKGRRILSEVASNPATSPKFLKSRYKRVLELQRRDGEGTRAPTQRPAGLFSLDPNNPQAPSGEQASADAAQNDDQANGKRRSSTNGVAHWEDEPMEIDQSESLFVSDHTPSPTSNVSDWCDPHENEEQPSSSKTISKTVQLGSDSQSVIVLSFNGLPVEADARWIKQFCSTEPLIFTHTCTRHDFACQTAASGQLEIVPLCEGMVFSCTENESLTNMASNLRLGSMGLVAIGEGFCVYMFSYEESGGQPAQDTGEATLGYVLFEPVDGESLGPSVLSPAPQLRLSGLTQGGETAASFSRPLSRVFGPNYEQLLPPFAKNAERHNFFIAFPPRAEQEALLLSWWLRDNNGKCDIRVTYTQGHWESFLKLTHGVVIIHEDALWSIRSFPRFQNLLHGPRANYMFWMFSRSLSPIRALGSGDTPPSPLGDIRLHRVFDPGAAFLVTPSFFISEPENAYSFMKWFWMRFVKNVDASRPSKLVVCAKVDEWMNDLSLEKLIMRHRCPMTAPEEERLAKGISDNAIMCRFKTFRMLQQLVVDASSEIAGRIVFAPDSIDGNDEQSLVNWFGWWSTLHIHQYRRFTVVGSSRQTEERLSRLVRTPNYKRDLMTDPDGQPPVLPRQPGPSRSVPAPRQSKEDEASMLRDHLTTMVNDAKRDWSPVKLYWYPVGFSDRNIPFRLGDRSDMYQTYEKWLSFFWGILESKGSKKGPHNSGAGLFYTFDEDQASELTIHNVQRSPWAAVLRPANPHSRPWRNTELFIWDTRYTDSIRRGKRFCYYDLLETQHRLIDFIADRAWNTLPLQNVWVGAFGAHTASVSAMDATLDWLASMPAKVRDWIPAPSKNLVERGWSPVYPDRLPEDRWEDREEPRWDDRRDDRHENRRDDRQEDQRRVREADRKEDRKEDRKGSPAPANIKIRQGSLQSDDDTAPPKTIFHPPRGGSGRQEPSKCTNWLYREAQQNDPQLEGREFAFAFRPTMDWYTEQCVEGRGFEHVAVLPWHDVFKGWKVESTLQRGN